MTQPVIAPPEVLPLNAALQNYLKSSVFLSNNIWKTVFSPCSHYLAIPKQDIYGGDRIVVISCPNWHAASKAGELYVHVEFACSSPVWSLAFGHHARQASASARRELPVNHRFDFTKNVFLAAGLADGKINVWNVDTEELVLILTDHRSTVCGLAFTTGTMQLASCSHDTTVKLWNLLDDGNMYKTLSEWTHVVNTVRWSPDERLLCAVGPFALAVLFDAETWEQRHRLEGHLNTVVDCTFSSDSALLATASFDTRVLLWSTVTGQLLKEFFHLIPVPMKIYAGGENGSYVRSVVFTKDDQYLISACDDNHVRWFAVNSSRQIESIFKRAHSNMLCVAAASDGKTLAVGTRTGEVHLWSTFSQPDPLALKRLCRMVINSHASTKRDDIVHLPLSKHLISYLLYRDILVK